MFQTRKVAPGYLAAVSRAVRNRRRVDVVGKTITAPTARTDHGIHFNSMPRIDDFQSFHTAQRTIQGFEAMLWLQKGFGFANAWTVYEQYQPNATRSRFLSNRSAGTCSLECL
jgi:hypothetical protein